jgi:muramidase (phage lysozyme)
MAIGDKRAGVLPASSYSNQRANPAAFGAGVGTAISGLAAATGDYDDSLQMISAAVKQRVDKSEDFDTEKSYIEFIGAQNRAQADRLRTTSEDAAGVTNQTQETLGGASDAFIKALPERHREEYLNKVTAFQEKAITSAFNFEYTAGNAKFVKDVNEAWNTQAAEILLGNTSAEDALETVSGLIARSDLDEAAQRDLTDQATSFLLRAEFQKELEYAADFKGTVKPKHEGGVVAAGLRPHEVGILHAISGPESNGEYDRLFSHTGVQRFTDFSDHPRIYNDILKGPNAGKKSSAAGKYQYLASTWDQDVKEYNAQNPNSKVTDFTPESQDRIAVFTARKIYNKQQGPGEMDFDQVLMSGNRELIMSMKNALTDANGGWEGLRDKFTSADKFANMVMGAQGIAGGGTGSPQMPDIWNDPKYADLTFAEKNVLDNSATATLTARNAAEAALAKQQRDAMVEKVMMDTIAGKHTEADMDLLVQQGKLPDSASVKRFKSFLNTANEKQRETTRVRGILQNGGDLFSTDNKGLNGVIGDGGMEAIRDLDRDYGAQVLLPIANRAGFFPSEAATMLNDMVQGSNPKAREYATAILSNAASADPRVLDRSPGLSESTKKQLILTDQLRSMFPAEDVQEKLRNLNDPTQRASLEAGRKEAGVLFEKNITTADIVGSFDTWAPGDAPAASLTRGQNATLREDYKTAYVEGWLISNDEGKAVEYANVLSKKHWSSSSFGGATRLTKYPPEVYYPTINGSLDWAQQQARNEMGFGADVEFQLVPDQQTVNEGENYASAEDKTGMNNATYQVWFLNDNGVPEHVMDDDGNPRRWGAEVTPEMKRRMDVAAQVENLTAERDSITEIAATGATLPPESAARYEDINSQLQELTDQENGDATSVVRPANNVDIAEEVTELEEELARITEESSDNSTYTRNTFNPNANTTAAQWRLRQKIGLLKKQLENN